MALAEEPWVPTSYSAAMVLASLAAVFAPLVFLGSLPLALLGLGLWDVGLGAQDSMVLAALADFVPAGHRGTGYGLFHMTFGVFYRL